MKYYGENGLLYQGNFDDALNNRFYIEEDNNLINKYRYPNDSIRREIDDELVLLYDKLRDVYFKDIDRYYFESSIMPIFVQSAGQDSDCAVSSELFSKWIEDGSKYKDFNIYQHLYLVDCQFFVGTIQNLLDGMNDAFVSYFVKIAEVGIGFLPDDEMTTMYTMSQAARSITALLESYFIKAYSILDMFCKIVYELENPTQEFNTYKKLKSSGLLWGDRKKLKINGKAKTIFEDCELIKIIESLRNEVVHNGSWELNPKVFVNFDKGSVLERYMLFPDIEQGRLATVKNRKHFFGCGTKVNKILPKIHIAYLERILNTVKELNSLNI